MIKAADYLLERLLDIGVRDIFVLSGGANLPIVDAIYRNPDMRFTCMHHEQAASMAAESYARIKGVPGVCLVTTGPGGTNAATGVLGAWQDSIPCIYISGQVRSSVLEDKPIRQLSTQGLDIVSVVKSITKYAVTVRSADDIRYHIEKAIYLARAGRPGPVWLDIPLDVASQMIDPDKLRKFDPQELDPDAGKTAVLESVLRETVDSLATASRPVLLIGTGVRLAQAESEMRDLIESLNIPLLCSWNIQDLVESDNPLNCGSPGTFGTRFANFTVQNSDLLLSIGSRISISQTGHNFKAFAREAKKIVVDIDHNELEKNCVIPDLPICCDALVFVRELLNLIKSDSRFPRQDISPWIEQCRVWKEKYAVVTPELRAQTEFVNSYVFVQELSDQLRPDDVTVLGVGTAFTGTFQSFKVKKGQRLFHSGGAAAMGYCLPGAIGACIANDRKKTICITGDGSIQLNLQELQTIIGENLPIKIFMFNNAGYHAIRVTQSDWFENRYAASSLQGGLTFPDMQKIATAFGFDTYKIENHTEMPGIVADVLGTDGPAFCEIMMDPEQLLFPYLAYVVGADGQRYPAPLEDLYPFLDRDEFQENMLIDLWENPSGKST